MRWVTCCCVRRSAGQTQQYVTKHDTAQHSTAQVERQDERSIARGFSAEGWIAQSFRRGFKWRLMPLLQLAIENLSREPLGGHPTQVSLHKEHFNAGCLGPVINVHIGRAEDPL